MNIQSIIIAIHQWQTQYATGNWTALRTLCALPLLRSLRVITYDIHMCPDDTDCQILAETTLLLVDFSFSFRRLAGFDCDPKSIFNMYRLFIEQLRDRILAISLDHKRYCIIEKDGCGLVIWR
jgi:hypothetical protein